MTHRLSAPRRALASAVVAAAAALGLRLGIATLACRIVASIALINLAGVLVFDVVLPRLRLHVAGLVRDLILAACYLAGLFTALSSSGVNLSGLVATSAVVTGIIAFALQDTLGNVMGGMVLQFERSLEVGDWIRFGNDEGVVREIRWRQTTLETGSGDMLVVPNSQLMKGAVTVLGRGSRRGMRRVSVPFSVDQETVPSRVISIVEAALKQDPPELVAASPEPRCLLTGFSGSAAEYSAAFWITKVSEASSTSSAVRTRLFFALARQGIRLSVASQAVVSVKNDLATRERKRHTDLERRVSTLHGSDLFRALNEEELRVVADRLRSTPFSRGEVITKQGSTANWLYIIDKGECEVRVHAGEGPAQKVAVLRAGDFMGEMALMTGEPRSATVVAVTDVECFRLDRDSFRDVVAQRPELATHISHVLAARKVALDAAREALDQAARSARVRDAQGDLLSRIRTFFALR